MISLCLVDRGKTLSFEIEGFWTDADEVYEQMQRFSDLLWQSEFSQAYKRWNDLKSGTTEEKEARLGLNKILEAILSIVKAILDLFGDP